MEGWKESNSKSEKDPNRNSMKVTAQRHWAQVVGTTNHSSTTASAQRHSVLVMEVKSVLEMMALEHLSTTKPEMAEPNWMEDSREDIRETFPMHKARLRSSRWVCAQNNIGGWVIPQKTKRRVRFIGQA